MIFLPFNKRHQDNQQEKKFAKICYLVLLKKRPQGCCQSAIKIQEGPGCKMSLASTCCPVCSQCYSIGWSPAASDGRMWVPQRCWFYICMYTHTHTHTHTHTYTVCSTIKHLASKEKNKKQKKKNVRTSELLSYWWESIVCAIYHCFRKISLTLNMSLTGICS